MLSIQNTYNPLYKDLPFLPKKINEQKNQTNFYFCHFLNFIRVTLDYYNMLGLLQQALKHGLILKKVNSLAYSGIRCIDLTTETIKILGMYIFLTIKSYKYKENLRKASLICEMF